EPVGPDHGGSCSCTHRADSARGCRTDRYIGTATVTARVGGAGPSWRGGRLFALLCVVSGRRGLDSPRGFLSGSPGRLVVRPSYPSPSTTTRPRGCHARAEFFFGGQSQGCALGRPDPADFAQTRAALDPSRPVRLPYGSPPLLRQSGGAACQGGPRRAEEED